VTDEGQISTGKDRAVSRELTEEFESADGARQRLREDARTSADDDQTAVISLPSGNEPPERAWAFGAWEADPAAAGEHVASDPYVGLINLGFISAALMRKVAVWGSFALIGLIGGLGFLTVLPPAQQASTTLLLQSPPNSGPGAAIADDQTMIESRTVAAAAIHRLRLNYTPAAFQKQYSAAALTNEVLSVTVSATSSATAVREANALATTFLAFQVTMLNSQNALAKASDTQQLAVAQHSADALGRQISSLKAQLGPGHQSDLLRSLEAGYTRDTTALGALQATFAGTEAANQTANTAVIAGSRVLDSAAPVHQSKVRHLALYAGGGLVGGLAIGMAIVVIGALVSDRLRRRDDIARILRAPVRLSVGAIRPMRWWPGRKGLALARHKSVQRIAAHLGDAVAPSASGPASLAVVPVDDVRVPAVCLVSLAVSCARQGLVAVVADLCAGAPAARLLKAREPGVREVSFRDTTLTVIVPDHDGEPMAGPLGEPRWPRASAQVVAACKSADVVLTLASVDPALGAEHLTRWASSVVTMVTAGESSAQRVFSVGEMIRLAGLQTMSAVLVGADKGDESLGVVPGEAVSHAPAAGRGGVVRSAGFLALGSDVDGAAATEIASSNGTA
jgi:capsular polysaccharide biosynthesis protein